MSYTAWSVSFAEQPSASKWNILGANDAAFNDGTGLPSANSSAVAVATSESTGSTSATDLATAGPSVTTTVGATGLALLVVESTWTPAGGTREAGNLWVVVSGASTVAAFIVVSGRVTATEGMYLNGSYLLTGLTPGSNTFKLQYSVSGSTGAFAARRLAVVPL